MDTPLEKRFTALAGPHAVVVPRGVVVTHGAEVHVGFPHHRGAQRGVHTIHSSLRSLPWRLVTADDGAVGRTENSVKEGQLDIWNFRPSFKRYYSEKNWKIASENFIIGT